MLLSLVYIFSFFPLSFFLHVVYYTKDCLWYPSTLPSEVVECFASTLPLCISFQTQPLWWYFLSALPKCLLLPVLFLPYGLYIDRRSHVIFISATIYVALYSFLPHKELRFIIYTVPLFNLVAAMALSNM